MNVVVLSDVVLFLQVDQQYIEQYMVDEQYIAMHSWVDDELMHD